MISLRPARYDELGLSRVLSGHLVPFLVGCMAFLAALALAGWFGSAALARHWEGGAARTLTVQVPRPGDSAFGGGGETDGTRLAAVMASLGAAPGVGSVRRLDDSETNTLIRSWLGVELDAATVQLPAVIAVALNSEGDVNALRKQISTRALGVIVEDHTIWTSRLQALARSLQLCSGFVLLIVTLVTSAVIAVATRSGLAARRDEVMIVHQLGATDGYIARRFANRTATLALAGAATGGLLALPVLFTLSTLALPLTGHSATAGGAAEPLDILPPTLWLLPVILPIAAAMVGYVTTQATMRRWLRTLR